MRREEKELGELHPRITGRLGGKTSAANLTPEQRSRRARKGAKARWAKVRAAPKTAA